MRQAEEFYKTKAWKRTRDSYVAERQSIDGGLCEVCHDLPGKIVHHKKHLTASNWRDPEIALSFDNLEFVCKHCHDIYHGYCNKKDPEKKTRVTFDAFGNCIPPVEETTP